MKYCKENLKSFAIIDIFWAKNVTLENCGFINENNNRDNLYLGNTENCSIIGNILSGNNYVDKDIVGYRGDIFCSESL